MIKLPDRAMDAVRVLAPNQQDDIARIILQLTGKDDADPIALSAEERAAIDESKAQSARGQFASEDEVRAVWAKHGL